MVTYKALGWTNRRIAREVDMSEGWVSEVTRQPWFIDKLAELSNGAVKLAFAKMMTQLAVPAAGVIEDVMNNTEARASDRLMAARMAIEQAHGKPKQQIEVKTEAPDAIRELNDLDARIKELEGQISDKTSGKSGGGAREEPDGEGFSADD